MSGPPEVSPFFPLMWKFKYTHIWRGGWKRFTYNYFSVWIFASCPSWPLKTPLQRQWCAALQNSVPGRITLHAQGCYSGADCFYHCTLTLQRPEGQSPVLHYNQGPLNDRRGLVSSLDRTEPALWAGSTTTQQLMATVQYFPASSPSDMVIRSLFEQHFAQMGLDGSQWKLWSWQRQHSCKLPVKPLTHPSHYVCC